MLGPQPHLSPDASTLTAARMPIQSQVACSRGPNPLSGGLSATVCGITSARHVLSHSRPVLSGQHRSRPRAPHAWRANQPLDPAPPAARCIHAALAILIARCRPRRRLCCRGRPPRVAAGYWGHQQCGGAVGIRRRTLPRFEPDVAALTAQVEHPAEALELGLIDPL